MLTRLPGAIPPDQCIPAASLETELRVAQDLSAFGCGLSFALALYLLGGARGDGDVEAFDIQLFVAVSCGSHLK
jgi:hypothetical protein